MQLLYACLVAAVLVAGAPAATAECGRPVAGFSPPAGEIVPRRATTYLFVPLGGNPPPDAATLERSLEVEGARFVARQIATSQAYFVVQIELFATGDQVVLRWKHDIEARYQIGAPTANTATVVKATHEVSEWACPYWNTLDMQVAGNAVAFRADWSDGSSTVMPADSAVFWPGAREDRIARERAARLAPPARSWLDPPPPVEPRFPSVQLGDVGCLGYNVDRKALAKLRRFELIALFSDGAEYAIGSAYAQLDGERALLPKALVRPAPPVPPAPSAQGPAPRELELSFYSRMYSYAEQRWAALGALASFVVSVGGVTLLLRRRRDHVPRY